MKTAIEQILTAFPEHSFSGHQPIGTEEIPEIIIIKCNKGKTGAAFPDLMTLDLRSQLLDRTGLNLIAHCHDRFYLRCSHGKVQTARPGIFHCCHHHIAFDCLFPASK